jgi:hypothetical protein
LPVLVGKEKETFVIVYIARVEFGWLANRDVEQMNQQTLAEARRILSVVDELIADLRVVSHLPSYMSAMPPQDLQHITNAFGGGQNGREVQTQLNEHYDLERKLESAGGGEVAAEDVADHHLSTRALLDTLRAAGYGEAYEPAFPASEGIRNFGHIMLVLRGLLQDRCHTSVEDDVIKYTILHDTVNREKSASADVQALNREYHNEKETRRIEVEKRQQAIRKVKEEIDQLRQASDTEMSNFLKLSKELATTNEERYQQELEELRSKKGEMRQETDQLEGKFFNEENALRAARSKKETTISATISEYDTQLQNLTVTIATLQKELDEDTDQLVDVERELHQLNQDAAEYELERRIGEQRKGHYMDVNVRMESQARIIQAFFRSFAVRLKASQKGKKKGKKKD